MAGRLRTTKEGRWACTRGLAGEIPMYHHILIPTDGSPLAGSAVEKGIALAKSSRGEGDSAHSRGAIPRTAGRSAIVRRAG